MTAPVSNKAIHLPVRQSERSPAVRVEKLCLRYPGNDTLAIDNLSLEIEAGHHTVVLGSSGSGKTSLLALIAGRIKPTRGSIHTTGKVVSIHQDLRLVDRRSVLSNVLDGAAGRYGGLRQLVGFPEREVDEALRVIERVGLAHRQYAKVAHLSGGEQQRVAIARALMAKPDVLLADEPVAALDPANAQAVLQLLCELRRERGLTLITVLHDCHLAERFADRIVTLAEGRTKFDRRETNPPNCVHRKPDSTGSQKRFEDCHACNDMTIDALMPPTPMDKPRAKPWRVAAVAVLVMAIYGTAMATLNVSSRDWIEVPAGAVRFLSQLVPDQWQSLATIRWDRIGIALLETIQLALLGTTAAVVISLPLSAMAARHVSPGRVRVPVRFVLNVIRAVPGLVWALLCVAAVGLGPLAGLIAIVAYSLGYLTKFFYEAFENVDRAAPDALVELGMRPPGVFVRAVWPASLPAVAASCVFLLEYNIRAAGVLGLVGAGGVGQYLKEHIDFGNYHVAGAILLLFVALVLVLDAASSRLRMAIVGAKPPKA